MVVRVISAVLSGALVCGLLGAPALAADEPAQPDQVAEVDPVEQAATQPHKQGRLSGPQPPLGVALRQVVPARVGGDGTVQVAIARRTESGKVLRNLTVKVSSKKSAARVVAGQGKGWRCTSKQGVGTCRMKSLPAGKSPDLLLLDVAITKKVPKQQLSLSAEVSWAGMKGVAVAASSGAAKKKKASKKPVRRMSLVRDSGTLDVYPRLRMKLRLPQGKRQEVMSGVGQDARKIFLKARVKGIDDAQVIGRWRQLSGPKVRFLQARRVVGVQYQVGQTALLPKKMRGVKRLRFGLTLKANGATVKRQVAVRVRGQRALGEVAPRYAQLRKLAKASKKRVKMVGLAQGGKDLVDVTVESGPHPAPGRIITLNAKPAAQIASKVKGITWFTQTEKTTENTGLTGHSVTMQAPKQGGATVVITAVVSLRGGRDIQSSVIIVTSPHKSNVQVDAKYTAIFESNLPKYPLLDKKCLGAPKGAEDGTQLQAMNCADVQSQMVEVDPANQQMEILGLCITADPAAVGSPVLMKYCDERGRESQKFVFDEATKQIMPRGTELCVTVQGVGLMDGALLQLEKCSSVLNGDRKWTRTEPMNPASKKVFCDIADEILRGRESGVNTPVSIPVLKSPEGKVLQAVRIKPLDTDLDKTIFVDTGGPRKECTGKGVIKFGYSVLAQPNGNFVDASGKLSTSGITIDQADATVNFAKFSGTMKTKGSIEARLIAGEWKPFAGEMRLYLPSIPFDVSEKNLALVDIGLPDSLPKVSLDGFVYEFLNAPEKPVPDPDPDDQVIKDGTLRLRQAFKLDTGGSEKASLQIGADYYDGNRSVARVALANFQVGQTSEGDTLQFGGVGMYGENTTRLEFNVTCFHAATQELSNTCQLFDHFEVSQFKVYLSKTKWDLGSEAVVHSLGRIPEGVEITPAETQRATAAVLAKEPSASVGKITKLANGSYNVRFTAPDGRLSEALLDSSFNVTSVDADSVYGFALIGEFKSTQNWSLQAKNTTPFTIDGDIKMDDISGKLERKPGAEEGEPARMLGAFTGSVVGIKFESGVRIDKISGTLTNACPVEENNPTCKEGEMRLGIEAKVTAVLPGSDSETSLTADALVNLTTREFTFTLGLMKDVPIGPEALQVSKAMFILSNGRKGLCGPGDTSLDGKVFHVGFVAEGVFFGGTRTFAGSWSKGADGSRGQCFWGYAGPIDMGEGMSARNSVIAYASYKNAKFELPRQEKPLILGKPNVISWTGTWSMDEDMQDYFMTGAGITFTAEVAANLSSASIQINYKLPGGGRELYKGDSARLVLTDAGFRIAANWRTKNLEFKAYGQANLETEGSSTVPASTTPVGVSLAVAVASDGFSVTLQAGVETGDQVIENAFGQEGMTLRRLALEATIAAPLSSSRLAVNADGTLPKSWTNSENGMPTAAKLAFAFGKGNFCINFQLGKQNPTETDPTVLNIGSGLVTAKYLQLLIAPWGCMLPVGSRESEWLPAGVGIGFQGRVANNPVDIVINVGFENGGTQVEGRFTTPSFDIGVLAMRGYDEPPSEDQDNKARNAIKARYPNADTRLVRSMPDGTYEAYFTSHAPDPSNDSKTDEGDKVAVLSSAFTILDVRPGDRLPTGPDIVFDIDTSQKKFDIDVDAAIEVGKARYRLGGLVRIQGKIRTSGDAYEITLRGNADIKVGVLSVELKELSADVYWAKGGDTSKNRAKIAVDLEAGAFGIYIGAKGNLVYQGETLMDLGVELKTGVDLLFGEVQGVIAFNMCAGTLNLDRSKGVSTCAYFKNPKGSSPAHRLSLVGRVRVLWWWDAYTWVAVDGLGTDGPEPPPVPAPEPEYIPGPTPQLKPNVMQADLLRAAKNHDVTTYSFGQTYWKAERPAEVVDTFNGRTKTYAPCQDVVLGSNWKPSSAQPNPKVGQVDPHNAACGLIAQRVMPNSNSVLRESLVCSETQCWVRGYANAPEKAWPAANDAAAIRGFRDKIIAGLRTPPGTIPAGTEFSDAQGSDLQRSGQLTAPAGDYQLTYNDTSWNLQQKKDGKWDTLWYGADFNGRDSFTYHQFTPDGELLAKGKSERMTIGVPVQKVTDPSERPFLFVQDGFAVYQRQNGEATPKLIWAVNENGNCLPEKGSCKPVCSAGSANCASSISDKPAPPPPPPPTPTYTTSFRTGMSGSARCLDLPAGNTTNGTQLEIHECHKGDNQTVTVDPDPKAMKIKGKCLEARGGSSADGTPIQINDCNGSDAQKVVYDNRQLKILGKCVNVAGGSNTSGSRLIVWPCVGGRNEMWDKY